MSVVQGRYHLDYAVLAAGDEVVIVEGGWTPRVIGPVAVTKVGKRDIVLANGRRFSVLSGSEQGRGVGGRLEDPDGENVASIRREAALRDVRRDVLKAAAAFEGHNGFTAEDIHALRTALDVAEGLLR